jgi:hypothetical protein
MAIPNNAAATPYFFVDGLDRLGETADRVNEIGIYLASSSIYQSNVANFGSVITLTPMDPLPTGVVTGSVAMSGSAANLKMFVYGFGAAGSTSNVSGWRSVTPTA